MIDAAGVGYNDGDTGSGGYTTVDYVTGVGKGFTVTPAGGDTGKTLFFLNAGRRDTYGAIGGSFGTYGFLYSAAQHTATNAWYLLFRAAYASGYIASYDKLWAYPLRCVRS